MASLQGQAPAQILRARAARLRRTELALEDVQEAFRVATWMLVGEIVPWLGLRSTREQRLVRKNAES